MQHNKINNYLVAIIGLAYIALITFQPSLQFMPEIGWFVDRQRLLELLLLCLVLTFSGVFKNSAMDTFNVDRKLTFAFLILLILTLFSISLAFVPRHATIEASTFAALCFLTLFVAKQFQEDNSILTKRLTFIIWASILLYMISFYTGYITATMIKKSLKWPLPFTGFTNIRSFNQYQLWTLGFILFPLLCFELSKVKRLLLHIALTAWWVLLFYSASRGVLIAWVIAMCLTGLVYQKSAWPFLRLQLMYVGIGFLSYQVLFKLIPYINQSILVTHSVVRQSTQDRIALWNQAIILIKNFPIFGVGPMHYAWFNKTNGHPHNSVLQLAAEWGLPATFIILVIATYGFFSWFKKFNLKQLQGMSTLNKNLSIILFFTIIANASYSLVDGVIVTPISQVLMFTMVGLMLGQYNTVTNEYITPQKARLRPWIAGLILMAMVWSTYPEIKQAFSGDRKYFSMGYTAIGPRYWFEAK